MAVKKLDYKQIAIAYAGASVACVVTGAVSGALWSEFGGNTDYSIWIGGTWLIVVGMPSLAVASDTLLKVLGKKEPIKIIGNAGHQGRAVPINYGNGKRSQVFLSSLTAPIRLRGSQANDQHKEPPQPQMSIPQTFTVVIDGTGYQVPIADIREFLHTAWQRQRQGKPAFSRNWWTKQRRPRMHPKEHQAMMLVLDQATGAIVNRGQGRSGKLALPPEATIKSLQGLM